MHDLVNIVLRHFGVSILNYPLLISAPVYSLAVFAVSLAIVSVIKKIPVVNKYLV